MSVRTEMIATVTVCVLGAGYFGWRALTADGDERLTYLAFIIVGGVLAHRAIRDVRERRRAEAAEAAGGAPDKE